MNTVNPKQIILAREARGLTQGQLVKKIPALNQGNFSKLERGLLSASEETIQSIADQLNFPLPFFYEEDVRPAMSNLYYRKQYKVSGNTLKTLRAKVSIITRAISKLMEGVDMEMKFQSMRFDLSESDWTPKTAALYSREILGIPHGPIKNLIGYIEKSGIIVYYTPFDVEGFDGLAAFTDSGWPILFINGSKPNDRIRMNIAHETGHVSMHIPFVIEPNRNEEVETRGYAGEFLMPSHEIRKDLVNLRYEALTDLKEYWKVSKAALIQKAYSLGQIEMGTYIYLRNELSRRGEFKNENGYVDLDKPELLQKIIKLYRDNEGYTDQDLADMTNLSIGDFNSFFGDRQDSIRIKRMVPTI